MFTFIEANYHQPISLGDVAKAVGYSPAYLTNLAQELTGYSIKRWIIEQRMSQARQLLRETDQPVRQIAGMSGPAARIAQVLDVPFSRPRCREELDQYPDYHRLTTAMEQHLSYETHVVEESRIRK